MITVQELRNWLEGRTPDEGVYIDNGIDESEMALRIQGKPDYIEVGGKPLTKYTVFCRQANDMGTTWWIGPIWASDLESAKTSARYQCASDWEYNFEDVRVIGIVEGCVTFLEWNDLDE